MKKITLAAVVAIVVVEGDKTVFMQAYGIADCKAGQKADLNTLYYIASLTKSFTVLAAEIDREGKTKLADPLSNYAASVSQPSSHTFKVDQAAL